MPHTKPQQDIEFGFGFVQSHGLRHGIAHDLLIRMAGGGVFILNANVCLGHSAVLADYGNHLESMIFQNLCNLPGFPMEPPAKGEADLFIVAAFQQIDDLHHAGIVAIAFRFHTGGLIGNAVDFFLFILLEGFALQLAVFTGAIGQGFLQILLGAPNKAALGAIVHDKFSFPDRVDLLSDSVV